MGNEPTGAAPGTSEKIEVLRERASKGYPLWHPHDCGNYRGMKSVPITTWQRRDERAKEMQVKQSEGCEQMNANRDVVRLCVTRAGGWRCKLSCGHIRTIGRREKKPSKLLCPRCAVAMREGKK